MSAGAFTLTGYEADYGDGTAIHPIRIQPETAALVINAVNNTGSATVNISNPISAQVSRSRKALGLHSRMVSIRFTATPPTGYLANQILRVPLLNQSIKEVAVAGATGTYLGVAIQVVSNFSPEVVR